MPQALEEVSEPLNILFYGDGGTGKTTNIASMAHVAKKGQKVWIANAESGVKASALKRHGIPIDKVELFPGPGEELTFDGLESEWLRIREALDKDPDSYIGCGWDSITEIQQALKDVQMKAAVAKANRLGRERSPFVIDQDDWRTINEQCRQLIRKFRDLPCHFAASALQRREQDNDGAVVYMPSVTPGLQNDLIGWMDVVCHTSVALVDNEEEYRGLFRPHSKYRGKDRFKIIPKWVVDPDFYRVLQYVEGDLDADSDPVMQEARDRAVRAKAAEDSTPVPA